MMGKVEAVNFLDSCSYRLWMGTPVHHIPSCHPQVMSSDHNSIIHVTGHFSTTDLDQVSLDLK
jgi:hypothetical protein